jgi:hypothetical protein
MTIVVQRAAVADEARRGVRDLLTVFFVRVPMAFSGQHRTKNDRLMPIVTETEQTADRPNSCLD